jgi:ubiquinone/menaquinone biosynthesis C-methylase UbiE
MFNKFIANQFKNPTGLFGRFTSNLMIKNNHHNYQTMIKELDVRPGEKILEIGYGPGVGLNMLATECADCKIYGLDFSPLMYKRARKYNKAFLDKGTMVLEQGDFLKQDFIEKDFDKIFCLNVIYFWDELHTPFVKAFSLLKQGGLFCFYMASKESLVKMKAPDAVFNKYAIEEVESRLKSAGFTQVSNRYEKGFYVRAIK